MLPYDMLAWACEQHWATSAAKGQFHEPVGFPWCQGPPRNLLRYQGSRNVGWRIAPGLPFSANLAAARSSAHKLQAFPTYPTWTRIQSNARDVQWFRNDSAMIPQWFRNDSAMIPQWFRNDSPRLDWLNCHLRLRSKWLSLLRTQGDVQRLSLGIRPQDQTTTHFPWAFPKSRT